LGAADFVVTVVLFVLAFQKKKKMKKQLIILKTDIIEKK
jgi:hypothetical protein